MGEAIIRRRRVWESPASKRERNIIEVTYGMGQEWVNEVLWHAGRKLALDRCRQMHQQHNAAGGGSPTLIAWNARSQQHWLKVCFESPSTNSPFASDLSCDPSSGSFMHGEEWLMAPSRERAAHKKRQCTERVVNSRWGSVMEPRPGNTPAENRAEDHNNAECLSPAAKAA